MSTILEEDNISNSTKYEERYEGIRKVNILCVIKTDPILYYLLTKLKMKPYSIGVMFTILSASMIPWSILTGVWKGIDYPLSLSYTTYYGDIILGFTTFLVVRYYKSIPDAINKLIIDGNIYCYRLCGKDISIDVENRYKSVHGYIVICISSAVSLLLHTTFLMDGLHGWTEISREGGWSALGYYHMLYFSIIMSVIITFLYNVLLTTILLWRVRGFSLRGCLDFKYNPICFYRSGGLKPIGDMAMRANMIFFTIGVYCALVVYTTTSFFINSGSESIYLWQALEILLPIPVYIVFCPLIFLLQVLPVHFMMRDAKKYLVRNVENGKDNIGLPAFSRLAASEITYDEMNRIESSMGLYSKIMELPEWPFDIKSIVRLLSTIVIPSYPVIAQHFSSGISYHYLLMKNGVCYIFLIKTRRNL